MWWKAARISNFSIQAACTPNYGIVSHFPDSAHIHSPHANIDVSKQPKKPTLPLYKTWLRLIGELEDQTGGYIEDLGDIIPIFSGVFLRKGSLIFFFLRMVKHPKQTNVVQISILYMSANRVAAALVTTPSNHFLHFLHIHCYTCRKPATSYPSIVSQPRAPRTRMPIQ